MQHCFEIECALNAESCKLAGVVGGEVSVCNGTVTLRLEEHDDR